MIKVGEPTILSTSPSGEISVAAKFGAVSLVGFLIDAALLRAGLAAGVSAAWARALSLFCAMQTTFLINGLIVFRCLSWRRLPRQWAGYMAANGTGNLVNYWSFVTMISTHWPVIANPAVALVGSCFVAFAINFAGTRFLVFGSARTTKDQVRRAICHPSSWRGASGRLRPAERPGPSPRSP